MRTGRVSCVIRQRERLKSINNLTIKEVEKTWSSE